MFDTVRLRTTGFTLNRSIINQFKNHEMTYYDNETMTESTRYTLREIPNIPHIRYYDKHCTLELECSIPKYLYGENVTLIDESDIDRFFILLHQQLYEMFGLVIHHRKEWRCLRTDVCWNFQLGNLLPDYMRQLAMMRLSRLTTVTYNQTETVVFQNKSKRITFYNKEAECRYQKYEEEVIQRAGGILRMEISPPDYQMKKYAHHRTAADLLTREFFEYITREIMPLLHFTETDEYPSDWIKAHSIAQIETILGFNQLKKRFGEGGLKQMYATSTLRNRMILLRTLTEGRGLAPLRITIPEAR